MIHMFVGMLVFTFFAIGGLIVDVGFARLSQRQMAQATDAASIEGTRLKDTVGTTIDDVYRRQSTSAVIEAHFDDDFNETLTDKRQYGAGPLVTLGPGVGTIGANAQILVDPANPVFKPTPQLNLRNNRHGDQVDGTYYLSMPVHWESFTYRRTDFRESVSPSSGDPSQLDAFLVRLRRTRDDFGLDGQAGTSSHGPALPYLFGQGSMIAAQTRQRAMNVRATSIAAARRATLVGLPDPALGLPGTTPFLLDLGYWNALPEGQTVRLRFDGNGKLIGSSSGSGPAGGPPQPNPFFPYADRGGPPIIPPGQINAGSQPIGMLADRLDQERRAWSIGDDAIPRDRLTLGQIMAWLGNPDLAGYVPGTVYYYVPIYEGTVQWDGIPGRQPGEDFKAGDPRVVGFGTIAVLGADRGDDDDEPEIEILKLPTYVAPFNASSVETPGLAGALAATIMERYAQVDEPLRAAALVR